MKTIIKLLIVALIAYAGFQAGRSYYEHHAFRRDVHMEMLNGGFVRSGEIQARVLEMATERGYVMTPEDVEVAVEKEVITIDMKWVDLVELVPRVYLHSWPYEGRVEVTLIEREKLIQ
jgi:hypothetical protein